MHPLTSSQKLHFLARLDWSGAEIRVSPTPLESTPFTFIKDGVITERLDRPFLIVSSTSWTPDEDFSILLRALNFHAKNNALPINCIITGKGPLKSHYLSEIKSLNLHGVKTVWLELEDYPLLIASADYGVSLHASSSGLDLPMKIVDLFGCGVPVLALNFNWYVITVNVSLSELVVDGEKYDLANLVGLSSKMK